MKALSLIKQQIPSRRKRFRMFFRLTTILIATIATWGASILFEERLYGWALVVMIIIFFVSIIEFIVADIVTEYKFPKQTVNILEKLESRLHDYDQHISTAISEVIKKMEGVKQEIISGTFHLEIDKYLDNDTDETENALVQVTKYTGGIGGKAWRVTPVTKGVVGRCMRTQMADHVNFVDQSEFEARMVKDFGFTKNEITKITKDGRSYYAHPVFANSKAVGVLYLFSTEPNVFPKAIDVNEIQSCSNSIVGFLKGARIL